jgi:hypothetical protein
MDERDTMQVAYLVFADAAQVGADGKVSMIGGDFDTINVQSLPAHHPNVALVMRLHMSPSECGVEHRLRVTVFGPLGAVLATIEGSFTPMAPPGHKGSRPVRSLFVINVAGLVFEMQGTYRFKVAVDDKQLHEAQLDIVRVPLVG